VSSFWSSFVKPKLRLKSKDVEPSPGKEIQVSVCGEDKVVCGVTKHTTCLDMIQALLDDHKTIPESKRQLHGEAKEFCLVERWKGFERAIPPLTRILRLWYAWGDQRPFVQFILVKTSDFVAQPTKKSTKPKGARPKRYEQNRTPQSLPSEKQKRVVRKAFRKLEKLHKENKSSLGSEEVDKMVQLILNQDHTIREQIRRMRDLDSEIERIEVNFQRDELEVQACGGWNFDIEEQLNQFLYTSDGVEQLESQVQKHHKLILKLSEEIDEELRKETEKEGANSPRINEEVYGAELERLQSEIKRTLFAGVSLQNQASDLDKQLKYFDAALIMKDEECWELASQLNSLQMTDFAEEMSQPSVTSCSVLQKVKLKDSLHPLELTDTDSDTGISSTHSQDSLSPGFDFPPPLDTDV
uniref:Ras-associating domain-containing protein n=1 Tax=Periophthalmus magnuspinnatus TaxID=409849 RepID=A0A3B3ZW02_9GOBI